MAAVGNSTIGVLLEYIVESTAGTRPTTGEWTRVPNVKDIPDIANEAGSIQVTPLEETYAHRYIPGLRDTGGVLAFVANNTDEVQTAWAGAVSAYGALTGGKTMWWRVTIPGVSNKFFFAGQPVANGLTGMGVDEAADLTLNVACEKVEGWAAA